MLPDPHIRTSREISRVKETSRTVTRTEFAMYPLEIYLAFFDRTT